MAIISVPIIYIKKFTIRVALFHFGLMPQFNAAVALPSTLGIKWSLKSSGRELELDSGTLDKLYKKKKKKILLN